MDIEVKLNTTGTHSNATLHRFGVWRFLVWNKQDAVLPFMSYNMEIVKADIRVEELIGRISSFSG